MSDIKYIGFTEDGERFDVGRPESIEPFNSGVLGYTIYHPMKVEARVGDDGKVHLEIEQAVEIGLGEPPPGCRYRR